MRPRGRRIPTRVQARLKSFAGALVDRSAPYDPPYRGVLPVDNKLAAASAEHSLGTIDISIPTQSSYESSNSKMTVSLVRRNSASRPQNEGYSSFVSRQQSQTSLRGNVWRREGTVLKRHMSLGRVGEKCASDRMKGSEPGTGKRRVKAVSLPRLDSKLYYSDRPTSEKKRSRRVRRLHVESIEEIKRAVFNQADFLSQPARNQITLHYPQSFKTPTRRTPGRIRELARKLKICGALPKVKPLLGKLRYQVNT